MTHDPDPPPVVDPWKDLEFDKITRQPILLGESTVMLIQLFHVKTHNLSDCWAWDYIDALSTIENAAAQLIAQLEDHWSPAFLMALRKAITEKLRQHDSECGTEFASRDQ